MNLFGSDDKETEETTETNTEPETVTKTKEYTEHVAEIVFTDGETKEVVFDSVHVSDVLVFKDYCGYSPQNMYGGGFKSEKFLTVPIENVKYFETTERRKKEFEYEVDQ